MGDLNIGILGAGVVGLTTALQVQQEFRNASVEVIADSFNEDTTSFVAAGLFRPGTSFCGPNEDVTREWIRDAYAYWDELRRSQEASQAGVTELSGYIFSSQFPGLVRNHFIEDIVPLYRRASEDELRLCPGDWKYGSFFTTLLAECELFLPWATRKFEQNGGRITKKTVQKFADVAGKYDAVVNCTGLGAKFLCNDHKLVPIRGQLIKVRANWVKTFFYGDHDTYIIPGFNSVTLGGCRHYDSFNKTIDKYDTLSIRERCESLLPSLRGAPVVAHRVGLRPHRDTVRVEKQNLNVNGEVVKIIHNYGHGGYGVSVAPGTSKYAVKLLKESLAGNSKL